MANAEHDPVDLLSGGALIVWNVGLTIVGVCRFGGGAAGLVAYIAVPGVIAWAVTRLLRCRRRRPGRAS